MNFDNDVLLVGCGNMGQALVKGWLAEGCDPSRIQVIEPNTSAANNAQALNLNLRPHLAEINLPIAVVVFAIKPQQLEPVLPEYVELAGSGTVFLSIAAGRPISFYESHLGADAAIVRGMPNTPAAIGQGMTVLTANGAVTADQRDLCQSLMECVGDVAWLDDEKLMNAVTAVSGSGPAYVFLLVECLTDAAVTIGLDPDLARRLAQQTVAGAGAYALSCTVDADELRRRVTSPGGTTEAALEVLMKNGALGDLVNAAVSAANKRGRELA
jgi:pyrroline-5-carboxylate reductase